MESGVVAFLDALGFKGIWERHDPGRVILNLKQLAETFERFEGPEEENPFFNQKHWYRRNRTESCLQCCRSPLRRCDSEGSPIGLPGCRHVRGVSHRRSVLDRPRNRRGSHERKAATSWPCVAQPICAASVRQSWAGRRRRVVHRWNAGCRSEHPADPRLSGPTAERPKPSGPYRKPSGAQPFRRSGADPGDAVHIHARQRGYPVQEEEH